MPLPSVTKQFSSLVAPDFIVLGFAVESGKRLRRVKGDILQAVFIHVETRMRREFMIEYCALLVCVPHPHYSLEHGGRFPVGSRGTWFRADTPEKLEQSMSQVRTAVPALLDWFRASETLDGFLGTFSARMATQPPAFARNGHASMTLACGYAAAGDSKSAKAHAARAVSEFESILASYRAEYPKDTTHWAPVCIERARSLITAIEESTTEALLAEWRALTTDALRLAI